jgi:hypothetical protein
VPPVPTRQPLLEQQVEQDDELLEAILPIPWCEQGLT